MVVRNEGGRLTLRVGNLKIDFLKIIIKDGCVWIMLVGYLEKKKADISKAFGLLRQDTL